MIPTYCIAHREPRLSAHLYDVIIHTPPRADYETLVSVVAHPIMAALAPLDGMMKICGWRKIVTRGVKSHGTISEATCADLPRKRTEPREGHEFLICAHNFFELGGVSRTIREQWDCSHHKRDLTDCLNLAEEMGVMTREECRALEAEPALIEGGLSMGVFPGWLVRESINKVFPLYREFARRYAPRFGAYDPVQRRCIPFLAERIETHFILKELRRRYANELPAEILGCLVTSWEGPWESGTIGGEIGSACAADIRSQVTALRAHLLSIHGQVASPNLTEAIDSVNALAATVRPATVHAGR